MYRLFQTVGASDLLDRLRVAMGYPGVHPKGPDNEELAAAVASAENLFSFRFAPMQRPHWLRKARADILLVVVQAVNPGAVSGLRRFPSALRGRNDEATRANPSR